MKQRPVDGLFPLLGAQLEVLRAQMHSDGAGEARPGGKEGGAGGAGGAGAGAGGVLPALVAALQQAMTRAGGPDADEGEG